MLAAEQLFFHRYPDNTPAKDFEHRFETTERDVEKCPVLAKPTFQNNSMEVGIPTKHVAECLVGNNHPDQQRSLSCLPVELAHKTEDEPRDVREKPSVVPEERPQGLRSTRINTHGSCTGLARTRSEPPRTAVSRAADAPSHRCPCPMAALPNNRSRISCEPVAEPNLSFVVACGIEGERSCVRSLWKSGAEW